MVEIRFEDGDALTEAERELVMKICSASEPEIRAYLPDLTEQIEVSIKVGKDVIPVTGEIGGALAPGRVDWRVDHTRDQSVTEIAEARLRATLFHEFHHLVRGWVMSGGDLPKTLMHGVVSEGLATAFERDAAGASPPWGEYPENVEEWVKELLELPLSASYVDWMFVHPDGRHWIGYRSGTFIADQAIKASGKTAAQLVRTPTEEILRMAGYGQTTA
jgi:hypothetical protein